MELEILGSRIEIDETRLAEAPAAIRTQVREYERGTRRRFDVTVDAPSGTTGAVMDALLQIPYGETRTYGEVADEVGTVPIAVGQACARNPVPLVVPCHRVVAADGGLRGYSAADGVRTKRRLLEFEARTVAADATERETERKVEDV